MKATTRYIFMDAKEYCKFLASITAFNYIRHHASKYPVLEQRKNATGYAEEYNGKFGKGWRVVIYVKKTRYNLAIYYIAQQSNQLDRKG